MLNILRFVTSLVLLNNIYIMILNIPHNRSSPAPESNFNGLAIVGKTFFFSNPGPERFKANNCYAFLYKHRRITY